MAWDGGGWLMTWFYAKIDSATVGRLRDRVTNELTDNYVCRSLLFRDVVQECCPRRNRELYFTILANTFRTCPGA
jgi:hypothetical protein